MKFSNCRIECSYLKLDSAKIGNTLGVIRKDSTTLVEDELATSSSFLGLFDGSI